MENKTYKIIKERKAKFYLVQLRQDLKTKNYYIGGYAVLKDGEPDIEFIQFGGSVGLPDFEYKTLKSALKSSEVCTDENIQEDKF